MKHPVSRLCAALCLCGLSSLSYAADVPQGTVLAQKQELVRHIKDEPASLDPAKAVGLPEIQVIRDLFEGLVNQNEKGELTPGVATRWQSNDNRIWTFTLRDNAKWSDGTPSPRRILSTAGSVWLIRKPPLRLPGLRRWQASTTRRPLLMVKRRQIPWA
jgi:ABC-type oligopeptide transport system substrate-binding subunit